jgi:glucose-1-phosphate thymidylyltransferase
MTAHNLADRYADSRPHGVLLLGGSGSRVRAVTRGMNKHLLIVGGLTIAERGLTLLLTSGVRTVTVVSSEADVERFRDLLNHRWDDRVALDFAVQADARGTADAVRYATAGRGHGDLAVLFGDNLFERSQVRLLDPVNAGKAATFFLKRVPNPQDFGVVSLDRRGAITNMWNKPARPVSNVACTGLMRLTGEAVLAIDDLRSNARGELDLVDLGIELLRTGRLGWQWVTGGWMDVATHPGAVAEAEARLRTWRR